MELKVTPIGNTYRREGQESDIVEVFHTFSGLRVTVSTWIAPETHRSRVVGTGRCSLSSAGNGRIRGNRLVLDRFAL